MVSLTPGVSPPQGRSQQRIRPLNGGDAAVPDSRSNSATDKNSDPAAADGARAQDAAAGSGHGSRGATGGGEGGASRAAGDGSGKGKRATKYSKMTWPEVKEAVTNSLGVAGSHTSMIQVPTARAAPPAVWGASRLARRHRVIETPLRRHRC